MGELLLMVKQVSEDQSYNTIEFNEFLQMMSKQMHKNIAPKDLIEAFRIFDKNDTGLISVEELVRLLSKLGVKMKRFYKLIIITVPEVTQVSIAMVLLYSFQKYSF